MKWYKIARLLISAIRVAVQEVEDAKDADSPQGKRVTPGEALEISSAILASLVEPLADILAAK